MERGLLPIATTMILQKRDTISLYPQFLSQNGKHYLNAIIQCILPLALWRTWYTAVGFLHALDTPCYRGTAELAHLAAVSQEKIEIDLRELEARGLLRRYAERRAIVQGDGKTSYRAVVVKDFTSLYDLAYEYHVWCDSEEYIPPERTFADFIKADRQLYTKLMRFDNYRRMLCCTKPGRKSRAKPLPVAYRYPLNESV